MPHHGASLRGHLRLSIPCLGFETELTPCVGETLRLFAVLALACPAQGRSSISLFRCC